MYWYSYLYKYFVLSIELNVSYYSNLFGKNIIYTINKLKKYITVVKGLLKTNYYL